MEGFINLVRRKKGEVAIWVSIAIALILLLLVPGVALGTALAFVQRHTGAMGSTTSVCAPTSSCYLKDEFFKDPVASLDATTARSKLNIPSSVPDSKIAYVINTVRMAGYNPALALATWKKESSYGTDPNNKSDSNGKFEFGYDHSGWGGIEKQVSGYIKTVNYAYNNQEPYGNRPSNVPIQVHWIDTYTPVSDTRNDVPEDRQILCNVLSPLVPDQISTDSTGASCGGSNLGSANGNKVCIDAGHNSNDSRGFVGGSEGANNLEIANKLNETLKKAGFGTFMTRTGPTYNGSEAKRKQDVNSAGCAVSISIHSNSGGGRGTQTYVCDQKYPERWDSFPDPIVSANGSPIQYKIGNDGTSLADVIHPLVVQAFIGKDAGIHPDTEANVMRNRKGSNGPDRKVSQDGDGWASSLGMVCRTNMPSILIEVGYHDNAAEASLLKDGNKQQQVANAITDGIKKYLGK